MKKFYYLMLLALIMVSAINVPAQQSAAPSTNTPTTTAPAKPQVSDQDAARSAVQTKDPAERLNALRKFLADYPDSSLRPSIKIQIFKTLVATGASEKEYLIYAEEGVKEFPDIPLKVRVLNDVAYSLASAGKGLDLALRYAEQAMALLPKDVDSETRAGFQDTLAWVHYQRGSYPQAIQALEQAVKVTEDPNVFMHLGQAYEKTGQVEKSLDMYLQAVVLVGDDEEDRQAFFETLKAAYVKKHGSDKGLNEKVAEQRQSFLKDAALVKGKFEAPAPEWQLKDINGQTVKSADLKGKVVVLDWWGSWCPPCRLELPHFQKLYDSYKEKGVVFLAMNWERPGSSPEARIATAKKFLKDNSYTFPVIIDHDREAGEKFNVDAYPTVFIIGRDGQIRYRTIGFSSNVADIIKIQLQSELARDKAAQ